MRRLRLSLLIWALPAALWAGEALRTVQLSLDFGPARPAALAPALSVNPLAAPVLPSAMPTAAVLASVPLAGPDTSGSGGNLPSAAPVPAPVTRALAAGDAHAFYKAVVAAGYDVPQGDDHQERLLKEGADREAADRAFFDGQRRSAPGDFGYVTEKSAPAAAKVPEPGRKPRATKIDYAEFGRLVALTPRLSESHFRDTEAKRRILMASGYTHLIGPGGRRIPLAIADEARVGRAFEHTLKTYRRRR